MHRDRYRRACRQLDLARPGSDALRALHTIVFDGDESRDFIRGIGLRFSTPVDAQLCDRHVRFAGKGDALCDDAVRDLT